MKRSLAPTTLENFSFSPPPFLSFFHASLSPSNMESFDRGAERDIEEKVIGWKLFDRIDIQTQVERSGSVGAHY